MVGGERALPKMRMERLDAQHRSNHYKTHQHSPFPGANVAHEFAEMRHTNIFQIVTLILPVDIRGADSHPRLQP